MGRVILFLVAVAVVIGSFVMNLFASLDLPAEMVQARLRIWIVMACLAVTCMVITWCAANILLDRRPDRKGEQPQLRYKPVYLCGAEEPDGEAREETALEQYVKEHAEQMRQYLWN